MLPRHTCSIHTLRCGYQWAGDAQNVGWDNRDQVPISKSDSKTVHAIIIGALRLVFTSVSGRRRWTMTSATLSVVPAAFNGAVAAGVRGPVLTIMSVRFHQGSRVRSEKGLIIERVPSVGWRYWHCGIRTSIVVGDKAHICGFGVPTPGMGLKRRCHGQKGGKWCHGVPGFQNGYRLNLYDPP